MEKHIQKFKHFWKEKKLHQKKSLTLVLHQAIHLTPELYNMMFNY